MDLKVSIDITYEVGDDTVQGTGTLNLASGDITDVALQDWLGPKQPWQHPDYDFASGSLNNKSKVVEFSVEVNTQGLHQVSVDELLEIKQRAAALFTGQSDPVLKAQLAHKPSKKPLF